MRRIRPNMAEQFGFLLDSLFMEGLQADLERLNRINALLPHCHSGSAPLGMRHVETLVVLPEADPAESAIAHRDSMPSSLRALLRILGARGARGGKLDVLPPVRGAVHARVDRGRRARRERPPHGDRGFPGARLDEEDRAEAEQGREPHHVGDGRQDHAAGKRRSMRSRFSVIGISTPAIAAATRLITIAMKMTAATSQCRTRARS
jgi:hypothetical protein